MAEEAYKCFQTILESVPLWISELEGLIQSSKQRQTDAIPDPVPTDSEKTLVRKASKTSSLRSRRSKRRSGSVKKVQDESAPTVEQVAEPDHLAVPRLSTADALRLSQRKRKTTSALSGHLSGPTKYRSRSFVVVYYDGDIQNRFESLVKKVSVCRNSIRKAKMNAKMERLARSASPDDREDNSAEDDSPAELQAKIVMPAWQRRQEHRVKVENDDGRVAFDTVDGLLEKSQNLCERAAHQILRDGDCLPELSQAKERMISALSTAERETPKWEPKAKKAAEHRRKSDERRRLKEEEKDRRVASQVQRKAAEEMGIFPSDGVVEVDSSEDEESESDGDQGSQTVDEVSASSKSQRRRANRLRPSAEWVEIPSDEIEQSRVPRLRGALRGLDPNAVLTPPATKGAKAASCDDNDEPSNLRSSLREGRNTAAIYSAKYHPMDDVTRPKRAERITGRCAKADSTDDDDSNESEPELGNDDDSDVTMDDDDRGMRIGATQHNPDPAATRHSKRSEARKAVIYNAKCHPQDYALPGFRTRHLARQGAARPKSSKKSSHDDQPDEDQEAGVTVEISSGDEEGRSDADNDEVDRPGIADSDATPTPEESPGRSPAVPRRSYRNDLPGEPRRPRLQNAASDVDAIHAGHFLTGHGLDGIDDDPLHLFTKFEQVQRSGTISKTIRTMEALLGDINEPGNLDEPALKSQKKESKPAALTTVRPYSTQRHASQSETDRPVHNSGQQSSRPLESDLQQHSTFKPINRSAKPSSPSKISNCSTPSDALTTALDDDKMAGETDIASVSLLNATGAVNTSSTLPHSAAPRAKRVSSAALQPSSTTRVPGIARVASSYTLRRSTNGSTGSREEMPPSSHFEDAFVPPIPPETTGGYTLSQLEKSDSATDDSLDDASKYCGEGGRATSAQVPAQASEPAASKPRPVLQPIDGNVLRPRSIFGPFNDETMAQPAVLKQSQVDSLAVKRRLMEGRGLERSSSFSGTQSELDGSDLEET
ncbi:hypothetical protein B0A48_04875 [Cryoendolithus antarcticus]|uniref:Uncharacterized protein n=1 Tax=Cryoendolithus antarcticus TaxID=1507870 RepID=A0A1V8TDL9_9PEZI|nr:hypothetical protein B0A48_04875 [Cryoendolithus antarcticus]